MVHKYVGPRNFKFFSKIFFLFKLTKKRQKKMNAQKFPFFFFLEKNNFITEITKKIKIRNKSRILLTQSHLLVNTIFLEERERKIKRLYREWKC